MGGCTNCKGKTGCDDRKGTMFEALDETLARLYPTRTWGELNDAEALFEEPSQRAADLAGLAEELAVDLKAATFVTTGADDELCDYIYILGLGRPPCGVQVRDHGVDAPAEWDALPAGQIITEHYLRVCVSAIAPMAAVQQVALDVTPSADGFLFREAAQPGVYDAPFLKRMQRLVAIVPAYDLVHLDFGEISAPPKDFLPGAWAERFGAYAKAPDTANYIFYPQPTTMFSTVWRPRAARAA